ncbi:MAG: CDP-glycerol:poly(glycerophosphate) glycerophosphotransferase [Methanohalophilus sp.]|nr:MAG: CDP-glycerol:poly(glycerophosphate) glycerophosphotransferase [Methanohalophilus sp.]
MKMDIEKVIEDSKIFGIKEDFNKFICSKHMKRILNDRTVFFDLWYHCMNQLLMMDEKGVSDDITSNNYRTKYNSSNIRKKLEAIKPSLNSWIRFTQKNPDLRTLDLIFISRDRFVKINNGNEWITSDYLFFSIIEKLKETNPNLKMGMICTSIPPRDINIDTYNVYQYIKPRDIIKALYFSSKKKTQWIHFRNKIKKNKTQNSAMLYQLNLFFSLKMLFPRYLVDYSYNRLFSTLNPSIVISNDDSMQLKPHTTNKSLKFITIQSAIMSPMNELYRRLFISEFGDESVKSDYFVCTGEYFRELKKDSCVSKNTVVMGQPRYDILNKAAEIYDKSKIIRDFGLDPNKKIILWTTQTHGLSYEENINNINSMYKAMSTITDAQLVIKLHPGEDQKASLYTQNKDYKPVILGRDADVHALLYACDIMITKNSTTALEAALLDKPVIILNLSNEPDRLDYVNEGIAIGVYDSESLGSAIDQALNDNHLRNQLNEGREKYIEKYLYKNDGKATERVVNLIESLIPEDLKN